MLPPGLSGNANGTSWRFSVRADGDFHIGSEPGGLDRRRQALVPGRWTWLRQEHGASVVTVGRPGAAAGSTGDAAVTATPGAVLAVHTADCVPVVLVAGTRSPRPVVGVAHVGWRGLVAGVLEAVVEAMGTLGAVEARAVAGPHIRPECYEFGPVDLDRLATVCGDGVRSRTADGAPAADLFAGVESSLARVGVEVADAGGCTACEPDRYYSHRARTDPGRHAAAAVIEDRW